MSQQKLFYEDERRVRGAAADDQRQRALVQGSGVVPVPHLKPESAYARLKACLNPEKDERLTFGQILAAMKFCERFDPLMFACDETLHARPDRKAPEDEQVRLVAAINEASSTLTKAMRQLERMQAARG